MAEQIPSVGQIVHYVSLGSLGGKYAPACRAATVTEVDPDDPSRVGLCVQNPTGLFFHPLAMDGGCRYDAGSPSEPGATEGVGYLGGSWHWPERA